MVDDVDLSHNQSIVKKPESPVCRTILRRDRSILMDQSPSDDVSQCEKAACTDAGSRAEGHVSSDTSATVVERRDVQAIFGLIATAILIFGLFPLVTGFLSLPTEHSQEIELTASPVFRVDINSATASELSLLPQVGSVLAERIVAERIAGGPFRTVDDLARTQGVGADRINRLRPMIVAKPIASQSDQATYRAAKIPTDQEDADWLVTPHSDLLFKRPGPDR
jgi:competence ComEA-like helix-hairpin-helix protein